MNHLQTRSSLSPPKNEEEPSKECCCEKPKKQKKNVEEIRADKQLTEIFRKELKKDIFKLCRDYEGKYWRDVTKKTDTSSVKKGHFLPPLIKRPSGSRFSSTGLESQYSFEGERGEGGEDEYGESRFGIEYDDDDDYRKKYRGRHGFGDRDGQKGKGRDGEGDGDRGRYGGRDGDGDKDRGKRGVRGSKDSSSSGMKRDYQFGDKSSRTLDTSTSDFSSDLDKSTLDYGEDFYDEKEKYSQHSSLLGTRSNYLLKYIQLRKLAAKLEKRASDSKSLKKNKSIEYELGYKHGFDVGLKIAFSVPPVYEDAMHKDFVDDSDDLVSEVFGYEEDSAYNFSVIPKKKTKVIYVSANQEQVNELKHIYKDVEIRVVQKIQLAARTEKEVGKKVEEYLESYKPILTRRSNSFTNGFKEGFVEGFKQTFIYHPNDTSLSVDEKLYVNEVRKCTIDEDDKDDTSDVIEALLDRASSLKEAFKGIIDFDAYEKEIESLDLKKDLTFTKSDFIFFYELGKKKSKQEELDTDEKYLDSKLRGKLLRPDSSDYKSELQSKRHEEADDHAWDYLNRHNIGELFRYMGIMLCSYKPDDPIDFLIKLLDKCLLFRSNESRNKAPLVFTEKHVESIYSNMDPFNYGHIDRKQYLYGLNLLEITEPDDITLIQNTDTVEKNQFLINANDRLLEKFRVMIAV